MITALTSPQYVNRVRQDWTANGGVYGDGGVYMATPANNPFAQLGPTLDLVFAGTATDPLDVASTTDDTLSLNFTAEAYQIAAQYAVWGTGGLQAVNFADIVTFTRASTATYFNASGVLTSAAIDVPRFDYDPATLAARGFLIEEQRTNSIRNNTMQGAVAGTPGTLPTNWTILGFGIGTLTQQVVGTGTSNGISYIDYRVSGTTSTTNFVLSFEQPTQIVAANGQTWANSAWVALIGGSTTNITTLNLGIDGRTAAGAFVAAVDNLNLLVVTPTLTRYTSSGTIANASIERVVLGVAFTFASGVAIDITLRIGLPQLELGAFATSVIPTTTTALTRSADVASVNTLSPWFNATEGTLFGESVSSVPGATLSGSIQPNIVYITDGTSNNRIGMFYNTGNVISGRIVTAGAATNPADRSANLPSVNRSALAYAVGTNQGALSVNGSAVTTSSPAGLPVVDRMSLGGGPVGISLNGHLRRITYYPRRLSNADLATITT